MYATALYKSFKNNNGSGDLILHHLKWLFILSRCKFKKFNLKICLELPTKVAERSKVSTDIWQTLGPRFESRFGNIYMATATSPSSDQEAVALIE